METEWKIVENTDGKIEVSNSGLVRSYLSGKPRILKSQIDKKGYSRIAITINRKKHTYKVHRLVAIAFLENPEDLPQVNHIDGNKQNNHVENLEWISNRDNALHAIKAGLWANVIAGSLKENNRRKKPVVAFNETGQKHFESVSEAERYFNSRHVVDAIKGKRHTVKGWRFAYESEVV